MKNRDTQTLRTKSRRRGRPLHAVALAAGLCLLFGPVLVTAGISGAQENVPSREFLENYMLKKAATFHAYRTEGIEPFLAMTLEDNKAFRCTTVKGEEVDFQGYLEIFKYTFGRWVYERIEPIGLDVKKIDDNEVQVVYHMLMKGKSRAGMGYEVERLNTYTFRRIKAGDQEQLQSLSPRNVDKYFKAEEDKWIVVRIQYG